MPSWPPHASLSAEERVNRLVAPFLQNRPCGRPPQLARVPRGNGPQTSGRRASSRSRARLRRMAPRKARRGYVHGVLAAGDRKS